MMSDLSDRVHAAMYRFRLRNQLSGNRERKQTISNPWHAISVVTGVYACDAAVARREQRVLSADAPQLPLSNCQQPGTCTCHYRHHSDRRHSLRRARDNGLPNRDYTGTDRRSEKRGQRATDV